MHLWKAKYTYRFSSSSGMESYHRDGDSEAYVTTEHPNVDHLREKLNRILGMQTEVLDLDGTEYLGVLLNR